MYKHYLITRFNIVIDDPKWNIDKNGDKVQTDSWLTSRFFLFEKYTLPSIKNQSCKDFKWLVLFNTETPDSFKKRIESYSIEIPQFFPLFVKPYADETAIISKYIEIDSAEEYVITTRIDNDDMIHRDYLKRVQEEFRPKENLFLSFRNGIQYSESSNILRKYNHITNHYTSRIEKREGVQSVIACNHNGIRTLGSLKTYNGKYMWVEIVHCGNLLNRERMLVPINIDNTYELYGVNLSQEPVNRLSFGYLLSVLYFNISAMYFYFRSYRTYVKK